MTGMAGSHARERALVLAALTGVLDRTWAAEGDLAGLDGGWLVDRLRTHALGALFWSEAVRAGLERSLPGPVAELIQASAHETAAHNARLVHLALEASAALDAAGVASLPLKGAAICLVLPGYGAARAMSDVDLLVHPGDVAKAAQALAPTFRTTHLLRDYDGAERDAYAALRAGVASLYTCYAADGAVLELHHAPPGDPSLRAAEAAFERARPRTERGRQVLLPSLDDLLGAACVHVLVHHGVRDHTMLLRHVADVRVLVEGGASAERARALYDTAAAAPVARSLRLLEEARAEALGEGAPRSAASAALDPGARERLGHWSMKARRRLARAVDGLERGGLRALVPPRAFMVGLYGPAASGPKLPLLHLRRWGAIVTRVIRGRR